MPPLSRRLERLSPIKHLATQTRGGDAMKNITGTVYLLHFSAAFKHAKHYVGFTTDLESRLDAHSKGSGARLLEVVAEAGISFELARTWDGTRQTERQIKRHGGATRLCPVCNPNAHRRAKAIN